MPDTTMNMSRPELRVYSQQGVLATFLFHGIFRDPREVDEGSVDPQQRITVTHFRQFVAHLLAHGYEFVSPEDVLAGLDDDGRYVMATFDDGYASNALVRPVLDEFCVPAVFFISTGHVLEGKSYWWDVLYREMKRRGNDVKQIAQVQQGLKELTNTQIEDVLKSMYGSDALQPWGDVDRPFTPDELREFARSPYVVLGNHTRDHAILTNYSRAGIREQLAGAQDDLRRMTGRVPTSVSYPNGNYSPDVLTIARELGLQVGLTVEKERNLLPLPAEEDVQLRLRRFTLWGTRDIAEQCDALLEPSWWRGVWSRFVGKDTRAWQRRSA